MTAASAQRWVLSGGGTGGHVTMALALGEELRSQGEAVLFLGGDRGLERELVPAAGFELVALPARPVAGRSRLAQLGALVALGRAAWQARRALRGFGADRVISVGGYAAVPAAAAALSLRIPLALIEPNAIPGRSNRLLGCFARRIFVGFDAAREGFGVRVPAERIRSVGVPLRQDLVETFGARAPRRAPEPPLRLLVFGGSQGARQLNDAMLAALPDLEAAELEIVHQTGAADCDRVRAAYRDAGLAAEVLPFEPELPRRYAWADLALCRAGALTVAELALAGLPALLVPYPHAIDDHQRANARELERCGAARLLDPTTFDGKTLAGALRDLLSDPGALQEMARSAAKLGRPEAARRIVEECRTLANG